MHHLIYQPNTHSTTFVKQLQCISSQEEMSRREAHKGSPPLDLAQTKNEGAT